MGSKSAFASTAEMLRWIEREFLEMIEAIKGGKFVEWIKEKFIRNVDGDIFDDIVDLLPSNQLSRSASISRIKEINEGLLNSTAVFKPEKPDLKSLGAKLFKSKNGISVDFSLSLEYLFGGVANEQSVVSIRLSRSRIANNSLAWKKTGLAEEKIAERGKFYVWHHLDNFDPFTGQSTLQLVEIFIHKKCIPHIGAVKQVEVFFDIIYKN